MQQCQTNKLYQRHRPAKQATYLQQKYAKVGEYTTVRRTSGEVCKPSKLKLLHLLSKRNVCHAYLDVSLSYILNI